MTKNVEHEILEALHMMNESNDTSENISKYMFMWTIVGSLATIAVTLFLVYMDINTRILLLERGEESEKLKRMEFTQRLEDGSKTFEKILEDVREFKHELHDIAGINSQALRALTTRVKRIEKRLEK